MRLSPLAIIPLFLLPACKMPESHIRDNNNNNGLFTKLEDPEDDNLEESKNIIAPDAPYLEQLPGIYYFDSIPIRGTANPDTDVLVKSPKGVVAGRVGKDGTFCVDLPLALNQTQDINVRVHNGLFSEYTSTTITQEYFGGEVEDTTVTDDDDSSDIPAPQFQLVNVALNKEVYHNYEHEDKTFGELEYLTDGITLATDSSNHVDFVDKKFGGSVIFWIDLEERHNIYRVELTLAPDENGKIPDEITVFGTTANNPGSPDNDNWDPDEETSAVIAHLEDNTLRNVIIPIYSNPVASVIGFEVNFSGNIVSRTAVISEVRVIERQPIEDDDDDDPPISPVEGLTTPSCANGLRL